MKYYERFLNMGCFTMDEMIEVVGNRDAAKGIARDYQEKDLIRRVKRGVYVAVDLRGHIPAVSKFEVASKIQEGAFVSHHSAFEYYGCANQVSYHVIVSSENPFEEFVYDGYQYVHASSKGEFGVQAKSGIAISDTERTVLDALNDFEKFMGLEEMLKCVANVESLNEDRLVSYLERYGKNFLYQKAGYVLQHFRDTLNLSDAFFELCKTRAGASRRRLAHWMTNATTYDKHWGMTVPADLMSLVWKGVDMDADV